jgi:hypothetical protein
MAMIRKQQIDPKIHTLLSELVPVPARDARLAQEGRARFLTELATIEDTATAKKYPIQFTFKTALALVLIGVFLFSGTVAVAAQSALPNASLYAVKLWTENTQLSFTRSPQAKAKFLMELAEKRADEIIILTDQGITPPEQVFNLLEQHIQQILSLAGNMNEDAYTQTMLGLREFLRAQQKRIGEPRKFTNRETERLFTRTGQTLQSYLDRVNFGLSDPQGFRNRENQPVEQQPPIEVTVTPEGNQYQNYQTPDTPGSGTPTPQPTADPKKGDGTGSGNDGDGSKKKDGSGNDGKGSGTGKGN